MFQVRLSDGLRDRIKVAAKVNGRSMNTEIVMALERAFPDQATATPAPAALTSPVSGLRDWFAGHVLAALTVNGTDAAWEDDAVAAYAAADAMLAAREAK